MAWTWRLETSAGQDVPVPESAIASFPSQADAESWLGESFPDLVASGVDQVFLLDGERTVYGPMSLHAP